MIAKGGEELLRHDSVEAMKELLLPIANVITPNLPEAESLSGKKINNIDDMKNISCHLHKMIKNSPGSAVVLKGGHLGEKISPDVVTTSLYTKILESNKIDNINTHGTGCTFSSALAYYLSIGLDITIASKHAKDFVTNAIKNSVSIGKGIGPTNPYSNLEIKYQRNHILEMLEFAISELKKYKTGFLIPEIQSNLGYALINAFSVDDVAAFPGRIIKLYENIHTVSPPIFGSSSHIARIILTVMKINPEYRSAMNIRYNSHLIDSAQKKGFIVSYFNRDLEPEEIKIKEGSSLNWGIESALNLTNKIPDFIYDNGGIGKEPVIRVLGKDPLEVVKKIFSISDLKD